MNATGHSSALLTPEWSIGRVRLANRVVLAPMAGITDKAFRLIVSDFGCGLICTEMISATALSYHSSRTKTMLDLTGEPGPTSVQIFGSEPGVMADAARLAAAEGAALIDINMGCPAPKVVKNNEGCALMRDLTLAGEIIRAVVAASPAPVTVKMRKGWDQETVNAMELAKLAEKNGAAAVTVHGRTRGQFYSGRADWDIIRQIKAALSIPVIGNGDIRRPGDARDMLEQTGCDAVMIGRGALGNPWLISRTAHYLATGELLPEPTAAMKIELALEHLRMVAGFKGEYRAVREMRKHIAWYIKGLRDAARIREQVNNTCTIAGIEQTLHDFLAGL